MRLFVAIDLPEAVKEKAAFVIGKLKELGIDVKFTESENIHFTLKFLGEVSEDRVKEIEGIISNALGRTKPFRVSVEGIGYFGKPEYIKTIWVDTGEGREELVKLARAMNEALNDIRQEYREPKPHLTLGRVKSGRNREALLDKIEELRHVKFGEMDVKLVKLKQSVLSREGPQYTDLRSFRLA